VVQRTTHERTQLPPPPRAAPSTGSIHGAASTRHVVGTFCAGVFADLYEGC